MFPLYYRIMGMSIYKGRWKLKMEKRKQSKTSNGKIFHVNDKLNSSYLKILPLKNPLENDTSIERNKKLIEFQPIFKVQVKFWFWTQTTSLLPFWLYTEQLPFLGSNFTFGDIIFLQKMNALCIFSIIASNFQGWNITIQKYLSMFLSEWNSQNI